VRMGRRCRCGRLIAMRTYDVNELKIEQVVVIAFVIIDGRRLSLVALSNFQFNECAVCLNRPLSSSEKKEGSYNIVDISTDRREVSVKDRTLPTAPVKTFSYDKVFTGASKQIELYKAVVVPTLEEVLLGYNCTIFA